MLFALAFWGVTRQAGRVDQDVLGLGDLVVTAEDWLVEDDSELGRVAVGDVIRSYVGIGSRAWSIADDPWPEVTWLGGCASRITGRVEAKAGVFDGFDLLCGPARFWMFTGAYEPPSGYVPPLEGPPDGAWVTVEGDLYIRPWYEVMDEAGMSEHTMGLEAGWPSSCDWRVIAVAEEEANWTLHLGAVRSTATP